MKIMRATMKRMTILPKSDNFHSLAFRSPVTHALWTRERNAMGLLRCEVSENERERGLGFQLKTNSIPSWNDSYASYSVNSVPPMNPTCIALERCECNVGSGPMDGER